MHIWTIEKWKNIYKNSDVRTGLRLRCDKNVDDDVKILCRDFCKWLTTEYYFPMRVVIYLRASIKIKAKDGDLVCGTIFMPFNYFVEPYIRIAAGDYQELKNAYGKQQAQAEIIISITHELTHYFQWVNNLPLTRIGEERQAKAYSYFILDEYDDYLAQNGINLGS